MKCQRAYGLNVRFWHEADKLRSRQVRGEREAEIGSIRHLKR